MLLCDTVANASGSALVSIAEMTQIINLMQLLDDESYTENNC